MKFLSLIAFLFLFSCGKKETVLLPKSDHTVVTDVVDHSSIYLFFKIEGKDTVAEVNRKNSIISTNWILNIDKRLPLRVVIPEIMKLQQKKREEKAHKNENAQNYYAYADTIGKKMAFLPFTNVYYKRASPIGQEATVCFYKDKITVNNVAVAKEDLQAHFDQLLITNDVPFILCFDQNTSYGAYIQSKVFMKTIEIKKKAIRFDENQEFIF